MRRLLVAFAAALSAACAGSAIGGGPNSVKTPHRFDALLERVETATAKHGLTADADATASLHYRAPSAVFAPYRHPEVARIARELDATLARIVNDAAGG